MIALTEQQQSLVIANLRVAEVAAALARRKTRRSIDSDALLSSAMLGLCNAARVFDPAKGVKFATYASRCCGHQIGADFQLEWLIYVPRYLQKKAHANHWLRPDALRAMAIAQWPVENFDTLEWPGHEGTE